MVNRFQHPIQLVLAMLRVGMKYIYINKFQFAAGDNFKWNYPSTKVIYRLLSQSVCGLFFL